MAEQTSGQAGRPADVEVRTPAGLLRWRAAHEGARLAYTFLLDGETEEATLTYAELDERARAIGATLIARGARDRRVLLLYQPGLAYVAALFGCFYAGAVAVPVYPPRNNRHLLRLQAIIADAQAAFALTDARSLTRLTSLCDQLPELARVQWLATDTLAADSADEWRARAPAGDQLALLQYTSGSTGLPRGVMLSQANLAHNSTLLARAFEYDAESRCVSWLPVYHDMGLIGGVLQPLYGGFPCVLMSPAAFLQQPLRWPKAVARYRATLSGGPNFAYDLCVRRTTAEQRASLDLSSWTTAFNGAEPIRAETLERFAQAFAPSGFRPQAFFPCYGLAEATLIVSGGPKDALPVVKTVETDALARGRVAEADADDAHARSLVGSGQTLTDEHVVVVNPETLNVCAPGEIGEIWVAGRSIAQGYWNRPEETAQTFRARLAADADAGPFLRTGDLGFIADGELFVTGRLKDLIIIRGRNHYPQDIELTVERSHAALRAAGGAAFSVEVAGEERLVVVQEVEPRQSANLHALLGLIRQAVAEQHELQTHAVLLLRPGSIPKTSSGKIQRHACRIGFLANKLDVLAEWHETPELAQASMSNSEAGAPAAEPASWAREDIAAYVASLLAARVGLSVDEIDRSRSLAYYGLDSLGAIELAHRLEAGLGVVLPMLNLLDGHSIAGLATQLQARLTEATDETLALRATARADADSFPLSHGQRALWFLQQAEPESAAYNLATALRIRGDLDRRALRQACRRLLARHAALRTSFAAQDGEPVQTVHKDVALDFVEEDAAGWRLETLTERLNEEAHRPFDLTRAPLVRVRLFARSSGEHVLLLAAHHIALDFWSLGILMRELARLYEAERAGDASDDAPPGVQYADFVRWQRELLAGTEGERLWAYWQRQLAGDVSPLNLPLARPRPPLQTSRGAALSFHLSDELAERLRRLARREGATLYMLLLAAYQVLLHRYTRQDEIVVGSSAAGRSRAELAGLVGYFVNPLALRGDLSGDPSFVSLLARVRRMALEAFAHQDYPFPLLVERLQPQRDAARTPLFQVMFVLHKAQRPEEDYLSSVALREAGARHKIDELELETVALEQRAAQFDLMLAVAELAHGLSGAFQYNADLFDEETISRMAGHYRVLLEGIAADPARRLSELPLLTEAEREQLTFAWNDTGQTYPATENVCELFEQQVERTPHAVAVVHEVGRLTYQELNERGNKLARYLRAAGVGAESLVGVLMERSVEMLVALVGVLKAGGAYVPLDPEYPPERLSWVLTDAGIEVLLTERRLVEKVAARGPAQVVCVDAEWAQIARQSAAPVARATVADNLAYVIYTSGSTGRPKGVMISQRGLCNYLHWCVTAYEVAQGSGAPVHSSIGFDLTVTSLFAPLLAGRSVVLSDAQGGAALAASLNLQGGYSFIKLTPSHLDMLNEAVAAERRAGLTNVLILGGEALHGESLARWRQHAPATRIVNEYGPTETVVGCCVYEVPQGASLRGPVPIGRPIANTQLYVLDERLHIVPTGVEGELYIGGLGLARGYLRSPELTAGKFVPHPFSREPGARLYRTGDRVRRLPDGQLEFLGRFDEQVKLRGYRIELGEIEAALREHAAIREAVVILTEHATGAKRLAAYYVAASADALTPADLRRHLQARLPTYMLPAVLQPLTEMPLTANGKVDRKALAALAHDRPELAAGFVAPRTETERALAEIWAQVLDIRQVGVHDNFFELGGHSLLATQIISRARDAFGVELPLATLLKSPTVAALAAAIDEAKRNGAPLQRAKITPVARARYRAPTPGKFEAKDG